LKLKNKHYRKYRRISMKYLMGSLILVVLFSSQVYGQAHFDPAARTGNLGRVDPGAILQYYTNPSVPDTYHFVDPDTVGLPPERAQDVINVEKKDIYGKIFINPETNVIEEE
jgi:hypothetical protein